MSKDEQIYQLWKLLDDIDTLDDAVKSNDGVFRELTRNRVKKRHSIVPTDELDHLYSVYYGNTSPEIEGIES